MAAVILGHLAHRQIRDSRGQMSGSGLATAGLVLGYVGLIILAIYVVANA
jgi:hypothetical protein